MSSQCLTLFHVGNRLCPCASKKGVVIRHSESAYPISLTNPMLREMASLEISTRSL